MVTPTICRGTSEANLEVTNVFVDGHADTRTNTTVDPGRNSDRHRSSFCIRGQIDGLTADFPDVRLTPLDVGGTREVQIAPEPALAAESGVTVAALADTIRFRQMESPFQTGSAALSRPPASG